MKTRFVFYFVMSVAFCLFTQLAFAGLNIAHRGASGYLAEHTLAAHAMAYAMGADYLEQDVALTKDDVPLVIHDLYLDAVTNVKEKFPGRARDDGKHYVIDFTYEEILTLDVKEVINLDSGRQRYPNRFPSTVMSQPRFRLASLREHIELVQGLNHSTGRNVGIYPELKSPKWHHQNGKDIAKVVLDLLEEYDYKTSECLVLLQSFDFDELKRVKNELNSELRLIQLLSDDTDLKEVSAYAYGVGPSINLLMSRGDDNQPVFTDFVERAHAVGLQVHPYTFRLETVPPNLSVETFLDYLFVKLKVDGIFTDFPDVISQYLKNLD